MRFGAVTDFVLHVLLQGSSLRVHRLSRMAVNSLTSMCCCMNQLPPDVIQPNRRQHNNAPKVINTRPYLARIHNASITNQGHTHCLRRFLTDPMNSLYEQDVVGCVDKTLLRVRLATRETLRKTPLLDLAVSNSREAGNGCLHQRTCALLLALFPDTHTHTALLFPSL
ncbi:hypothetical protein LX32DRAFT_227444 [Colletotrichum zoysiae]|uniref:Uncharacterized protein n=1 Tax=Colletotrichum zoysiae TaxID=1216348 RepID=A0AAD9HMZ4_9PEZI|nr:hypothetical protein LX32DRAFT_227444 [Colletotrichum zoysiae]